PYSKKCCIPQGCPFSMMVIVLLMRPWIFPSRSSLTVPRALADDLLIVAVEDEQYGEAAALAALLDGAQGTLDYIKEHGRGARFPSGSAC
ncbi:MAG: hypothetical protein ACKPKO_27330, partial [Candidatus Fonsibacter sp.]